MTKSLVEQAAEAIKTEEVQEIIKRLAKYGLGVCIPHMHAKDTGDFRDLPNDLVQRESQLQVSFVPRSSINDQDIPVAWRWNDEVQVAEICRICKSDKMHH